MAKQTIKLLASAYSKSNDDRVYVANPSNAYTDTTSNSYAVVSNTGGGPQEGCAYFYGFDFGQIPSGVAVSSVTFKIKVATTQASSYYYVALANRSTGVLLSASTQTATTATIYTLTLSSLTFNDVVSLGDNFAFKVSKYSGSYEQHVFGIEIDVTYDTPVPNKVDYIKDGVLKTLIDLTGDDTLPEDVTAGKIFHLATGEQATGTGGGLEYETGTWSPSSNTTTAPTISFSKTHTEQPAVIAFADVSTSSRSSNYFISYTYTNLALLIPDWAMPSSGIWKSKYHYYVYASSSSAEQASTLKSANINVSSTSFTPYTNSTMLRSSRVYNWIAIWA